MKAYYATHREEHLAVCRAYNIAHREERLAHSRAYDAAHRKEAWASRLLLKYGISVAAFNALLDKQGGVCAICGKSNWGATGPHVDHDHVAGKVCGILCKYCNAALGLIGDDPKIARAMSVYLEITRGN